MADFWDILGASFFPEHNLRVIFLGVTSLGLAAGLLGCFLLFRKRSLLSDTVGHATLPGVVGGFLVTSSIGGVYGKSFLGLLLGSLLFGWLSVQTVQYLVRRTRLRQDAALAVSLTGFYALGIVLLSVVQSSGLPQSSGLEYYLYGMVASMVEAEAWMLFGTTVFAVLLTMIFLKELNVLCFDETFTQTQGLPHRWLDEGLMFISLVVAIVGLQTVGLLLIMAMFIVPPSTARLWTSSLKKTLVISALVGAVGALAGALLSANISNLPAGATMILCTAFLFFLSLLFGYRRGVLMKYLRFHAIEQRLEGNQFLRAVFDNMEKQQQVRLFCGLEFSRQLALSEFNLLKVLEKREWSARKINKVGKRLASSKYISLKEGGNAVLTEGGLDRAVEAAKTHRLTEMYLMEHAEVASKNIHQFVERIEEITTPELAQDLKRLFEEDLQRSLIPPEPHDIAK